MQTYMWGGPSPGVNSPPPPAAPPPPSRPDLTERQLLRGITVHLRPGRLHCLIGGSGAGKSTLMDVVAGRRDSRTRYGQLLVNGRSQIREVGATCWATPNKKRIFIPLGLQ